MIEGVKRLDVVGTCSFINKKKGVVYPVVAVVGPNMSFIKQEYLSWLV